VRGVLVQFQDTDQEGDHDDPAASAGYAAGDAGQNADEKVHRKFRTGGQK